MGSRESAEVLKDIETLFTAGTASGLSDGQLIARFTRRGDAQGSETAFAALVARHGPLVLRVCRGVLKNDPHAADDAFQATFLILARKAASIRKEGSVASWLFGVARRVALRARHERLTREANERRGAAMADSPAQSADPPELLPEVQEEVERLPEKYRAPVVLCYFEGLTHEEAAGQLRLPVGTIKVRLARARGRLKGRLARRGLAPSVLAATLGLSSSGTASAAVPARLADATVRAAAEVAAGRAAQVSAAVATIVEGVLRAMLLSKLKAAAALSALLMSLIAGPIAALALLPRAARSDPPAIVRADEPQPEPASPAPEGKGKSVSVLVVQKGDLDRTTTQGATIEAFATADLYPRIAGYVQTLKADIGEKVKARSLLVEITADELRDELHIKQAEFELAKAKFEKVNENYQRNKTLFERKAIPEQMVNEYQVKLTEARASLNIVKAQLERATNALNAAKIYAPFDGIVTRRNASVGTYVRADQREPLLTMVRAGKVRMVTKVPDRAVTLIDKGDAVLVRLDTLPGVEFRGTVSRTAYALEPASRSLRVEVDLNDSQNRLRPGMSGLAEIFLEKRPNVLSLPVAAVFRVPGRKGDWCYRVVDARAALTQVTRGEAANSAWVEITQGIREGDTVIIGNLDKIKEGDPIEPKQPGDPSGLPRP